jgi:hypothetical protein
MVIRILGERIRIVWKRMARRWGACEEKPARGLRRIFIDPRARNCKELELYIHECLHAGDWHKSEEWVDKFARDMARTLWALGYRKGAK